MLLAQARPMMINHHTSLAIVVLQKQQYCQFTCQLKMSLSLKHQRACPPDGAVCAFSQEASMASQIRAQSIDDL